MMDAVHVRYIQEVVLKEDMMLNRCSVESGSWLQVKPSAEWMHV